MDEDAGLRLSDESKSEQMPRKRSPEKNWWRKLVDPIDLALAGPQVTPKVLADPAPLTPAEEDKLASTRDAINESSKNVWKLLVGFVALGFYCIGAVAGTTNEQLLRGGNLSLPFVGTFPLVPFYVILPFVFVVLHVNLLVHHYMVLEQVSQFKSLLSTKSDTIENGELRLLYPSLFTRSYYSYQDGDPARAALSWVKWLAVMVFPLFVLVLIASRFGGYHNWAAVTWHLILILFDLVFPLVFASVPRDLQVNYRLFSNDSFDHFWIRFRKLLRGIAISSVVLAMIFIGGGCEHWATWNYYTHNLSVSNSNLYDLGDPQYFAVELQRGDPTDQALTLNARGIDLHQRNLRGLILSDCTVVNANCEGADFTNASITRTKFIHVDFSNTVFRNVKFHGRCDFIDCFGSPQWHIEGSKFNKDVHVKGKTELAFPSEVTRDKEAKVPAISAQKPNMIRPQKVQKK